MKLEKEASGLFPPHFPVFISPGGPRQADPDEAEDPGRAKIDLIRAGYLGPESKSGRASEKEKKRRQIDRDRAFR
jgi:hypothetical protein